MTRYASPDSLQDSPCSVSIAPPLPLLQAHPQLPHPSVGHWFKRSLDIVGSLIGLSILAIIFVPVAIAIRLDSPGPVFYTQQRCGLLGRCFTIYKFRTMVQGADRLGDQPAPTPVDDQAKDKAKDKANDEAKGKPFNFKRGRDPRVTRVGWFLRKTSLDEFPQFLNVLRGEMSLVGTRPPTLDEVEHYADHHWLRLNVKPGITGEWQVNGRSKIDDFEEIVKLDLRYQALWHPLYDLSLILRTIRAVVFGVGAM
ncbi:MAG: hypothetical protein Fur0046_22850 [Cyanobacteria bacterium J069]|nr:MAG: sugar transferase [Cyanobacteria bacterium J069]